MTRTGRWAAFALTGLAIGAVCAGVTLRSWAADDATRETELARPGAGTEDDATTETMERSDAEQGMPTPDNQAADTPATDGPYASDEDQ
jgi:hypothetical protein